MEDNVDNTDAALTCNRQGRIGVNDILTRRNTA